MGGEARPLPSRFPDSSSHAIVCREVNIAAVIATGLIGVIIVFQLALAAGAPWGAASWGGRHSGVLPTHLRIASAVAGLMVYPAMLIFILDAADLVTLGVADRGVTITLLWVLMGLFGLATVANLASPSRVESLWAPVALGVAVCCASIAIGL